MNEITLCEETHTYSNGQGKTYDMSVTELISYFFPEFNEQEVAERYAIKHGITVKETLELWQYNRDFGSRVHKYAEIKATHPEVIADLTDYSEEELTYFKGVDNFLKLVKPIIAEQPIAVEEFNLAGTPDLLAVHGSHAIMDYKITKSLDTNSYGKKGLGPCMFTPASKKHKYELQLSMLRYMNEYNGQNTDFKALYLVHIHPKNKDGYKLIKCTYKRSLVKDMIGLWIESRFDKERLKELIKNYKVNKGDKEFTEGERTMAEIKLSQQDRIRLAQSVNLASAKETSQDMNKIKSLAWAYYDLLEEMDEELLNKKKENIIDVEKKGEVLDF